MGHQTVSKGCCPNTWITSCCDQAAGSNLSVACFETESGRFHYLYRYTVDRGGGKGREAAASATAPANGSQLSHTCQTALGYRPLCAANYPTFGKVRTPTHSLLRLRRNPNLWQTRIASVTLWSYMALMPIT